MTAVPNRPPPWVNRDLPRAPLCLTRGVTPRRARVPPVDYRDGLSPCLTNLQETDITTIIQWRRQHPRHTGRDPSEWLVAIAGMRSAASLLHSTSLEG